jgi:hypothetical protein
MAEQTKSTGGSMSEGHKSALAQGRSEGRAVRRYLEALEAHKPRRGRKRTVDSMKQRLSAIEESLGSAEPLDRLHLVQERMDLEAEISSAGEKLDIATLEADFVAAASPYSRRKGISYSAWRELGVPAATLKKAGIGRAAID